MITIPYKKRKLYFTNEEFQDLKEEFQGLTINRTDEEKKNTRLDYLLFNN